MPQAIKNIDTDLIRAELSRRSLKEFIKAFWSVVEPTTQFVDNWHIDAFCDHLTHIRQIKNLLVNVPPATSKSLIFSVFFPAWRWIHDPSERFLTGSYALSLSERDAMKARRLIASPLYQKCFGDLFQMQDIDQKKHYVNDKTGYRQAVSVGSIVKGLKGNFCVLDDPHNADEANSEIKLDIATNWYVDNFYDRLSDFNKDCRIIVGQRIARNDLSGYILENYADDWTYLCIPYEYRPVSVTMPNPIGWKDPREEEGEPLWPERFPPSSIKQLKRKAQVWSSQWNQQPVDIQHALFKPESFRYYEDLGNNYKLGNRTIAKSETYRIVAADIAVSQSKRADYTAIIVADLTSSGDIIIVHAVREKLGGTKLVPAMVDVNTLYQPAYFLLEQVALQQLVIDQARAEGLAVRGVRPTQDKETRSLPLQVRFESGQVWFPTGPKWVPILESELVEFPNGAHDDMVDALSYVALEAAKWNVKRPQVEAEAPKETYDQRMWRGIMHGLI